MRTLKERVKHTLLFELILVCICTPLIALILDKSFSHTGILSLCLSTIAMICNGLYNYAFDMALIYLKRPLYPRSFNLRCFHSLLFEICLIVFTLPMIMWWMEFSLPQAFLIELSFSVFVPVYALVFNWIYDLVLPITSLEHPNPLN